MSISNTKLSIIGSRGIPANYGGFETFAEQLFLSLKNKYNELDLTVVCDDDTRMINNAQDKINNIKLIYSKYSKSDNPLRFYFDSMLLSRNSDITIACGTGIGLFVPFNKFLRSKLIINSDGIEWKRTKWPLTKRFFVKFLEWLTIIFSDAVICDSKGMFNYFHKRYKWKKNLYIIEYGANKNKYLTQDNTQIDEILKKYNISKYNYHLVVCRLEPENNIDMIIKGFNNSTTTKPLVIIGNILSTKYVEYLKNIANNNVLFLGGIYDKDELLLLRSRAFTYIHGHSIGGTNPSLLEAMGSKNLCICHDNVFNRETTRNNGLYFKNKQDLEDLFEYVEDVNNFKNINKFKHEVYKLILEYYNWDNISEKYYQILQK